MPSTTMRTVVAKRTHAPNGIVRATRRDTIRVGAGASWSTIPLSRKRVASVIRVDPSNVSRRTTGDHDSHLSRAAEEAYRLESAGVSSAFMLVRLKVSAMYPMYERMTLPELEAELQRVTEEETAHDAALDIVQSAILYRGVPADLADAITRAHTHSEFLHRSLAIMELIQERRRTGRTA